MTPREARRAAGLTQSELAARMGVPTRWVQKLESGETDIQNVTARLFFRLADSLGVEPRELLAANPRTRGT